MIPFVSLCLCVEFNNCDRIAPFRSDMFRSVFLLALVLSTQVFGAEELPPPPERGFMQTILMLALMAGAMYFILIRPAQRQKKQLEEQQSALKVGDKVVAMGIVGEVSKIDADTVILKMVDGSKIEFVKRAITEVVKNG